MASLSAVQSTAPSFNSAVISGGFGIPTAPRGPSFGFKRAEQPQPIEDVPEDKDALRDLKAKTEAAMKQANEPRSAIERKLEELEAEFEARKRRQKEELKPRLLPPRLEPYPEPEMKLQPKQMENQPKQADPSRMSVARNANGPQLSQGPSPFAMAASGISVKGPSAPSSAAAPSAKGASAVSSGPSGMGGGPR